LGRKVVNDPPIGSHSERTRPTPNPQQLEIAKEQMRDKILSAHNKGRITDQEYLNARQQIDEARTVHKVHEALMHVDSLIPYERGIIIIEQI
jgi:flagellar biosynthesis regulator FlbT